MFRLDSYVLNGIFFLFCRGNVISLFRLLIFLNRCLREIEVNVKYVNSILNKGDKGIIYIYLFSIVW